MVRAAQKDRAAAAHFRKAVELDPGHAEAHNNLGISLFLTRDLDGAARAYEKAIQLNPDYAHAHCGLGLTLQQQGQFGKALAALQVGHYLGTRQPGWTTPSAVLVKLCERWIELEHQLPAIRTGAVKAKNPSELVELGQLCRLKKWYAQAAAFYQAALAADPKVAVYPRRYDAACAAALAAAGQGLDAGQLDDKEKARLRSLALTWLRADLTNFTRLLKADPRKADFAREKLHHWLTNPDLAGVRGEKALALLPEAEADDWRRLWAEVGQIQKGMKN
jgi:tetratricopeptide (TPR) repeat protein